jgi:alpha-D-ribose 1-methylphosphonate 5-triphosphate synthase subunit PhnH
MESTNTFDLVHDVGNIFRKTLDAWSYPGKVQELMDSSGKIESRTPFSPHLQALALMLLDTETTFAVYGPEGKKLETFLSRLCYAKTSPTEQAQFIFIPLGEGDCAAVLAHAFEGTLEEPHRGATVLIEVESIHSGSLCTLRGPGIKTPFTRQIPLSTETIAARNRRSKEFPLGIDLMVVDKAGCLLCLPRSTKVEY